MFLHYKFSLYGLAKSIFSTWVSCQRRTKEGANPYLLRTIPA